MGFTKFLSLFLIIYSLLASSHILLSPSPKPQWFPPDSRNDPEPKGTTTAVYLMNWCTTSGVHEVTLHEKYFGKKSDLLHTWIFGAIAYVHIPDEKRQKLDPKSEKCILVGYSLEQKGYKCYNPSTRKSRVSRDVVFDESAS